MTKRRSLRPDVVPQTRGDRIVEFLQTLKVPDGPDAGKMLKLRDWQISDIKSIYDPVHIVDGKERRLVRQAVKTVGRKNGKTSEAGGLLLAHLVGPEAGWNQQIYSAAFEREQAALVYNVAASMVTMDDELASLCRCVDTSKKIKCAVNRSVYKALSSESRSKHGFNPAFVIFDELAQFGIDRKLFDVLATSMGAQAEPLLFVISTQAENDIAVLSQMIDYGREVKAGRIDDSSFVLIDYSTPSDDVLASRGQTVWDEEVWHLANPALGDFRSIEEMRSMAKRAQKLPTLEQTFRNLYINQRVSSKASFLTASIWDACKWTPDPELLIGRRAVAALDLSSRIDLTALVYAVELDDGRIALVPHVFTPKESIEERSKADGAPYFDWAKSGVIEAVPGKTVDYEFVVRRFLETCSSYELQNLAFDRWRIDVFKKEMSNAQSGWHEDDERYLPFGQGFRDMTPAVEAFVELAMSGKLLHDGNPALRWAVANAVQETDAAENKKLVKGKSYGRIDPVIAAVMAVGAMVKDDLVTAPSIFSV